MVDYRWVDSITLQKPLFELTCFIRHDNLARGFLPETIATLDLVEFHCEVPGDSARIVHERNGDLRLRLSCLDRDDSCERQNKT